MPLLGAKGVFPGAEPLAPRCRRNAPFKKAFGIGEWLFISMMMLVRDFLINNIPYMTNCQPRSTCCTLLFIAQKNFNIKAMQVRI